MVKNTTSCSANAKTWPSRKAAEGEAQFLTFQSLAKYSGGSQADKLREFFPIPAKNGNWHIAAQKKSVCHGSLCSSVTYVSN